MYVTVEVTCAGHDEAERVAAALLDARLVACAHLSPIASRYEWAGERVADDEVLVRAVSLSARFDDIVAAVTAVHSYEVPAISATQLVGGSEPYLRWVREQVDLSR